MELTHRIRKAQLDLANLHLKDTNTPAILKAVLSAQEEGTNTLLLARY
ncbi:hypothetical protein AB4Y45_44020 [Paraburkholderia sp. EG287A]